MTKIDNEHGEINKSAELKSAAEDLAFGTLLKAAREQAGYTVERAAMATRIAQPFVEALERSDFEKLPGAVFGRGFIRNLCKAYGKDSAEILAAFDRRTNLGKGKDVNPSIRDEKRHQQLKKGVLLIQPNEWKGRIKALAPHHYLRVKPLLLIVTAVLVIGVLANQFDLMNDTHEESSNVAEQPQATPAQEPAVASPVAEQVAVPTAEQAPMAAPSSVAANTPVAAPAPNAAAMPEVADGLADVELRVKEPVLVKITKDQDKQLTGELKPDSYKYRFKSQLKLYIEDVSVVEIYFKGQRVPSSTVKGESKRITFQSSEGQIAKKASVPQL